MAQKHPERINWDPALRDWLARWFFPQNRQVWPITHLNMTCEQFVEKRERDDKTTAEPEET